MYNQDVKERFISDTYNGRMESTAECITLFNAFEEYERTWSADLCTRSAEQIQSILSNPNSIAISAFGIRKASFGSKQTILNKYRKWCYENGVPGAIYEGSDIQIVSNDEKMRVRSVANPKQFQEYLDALFTPESYQTADNTYRCWYWLGYSGATVDQAINTTVDQVNLSKMEITYTYPNGYVKVIPIENQAFPAFKNCVELEQFSIVYQDNATSFKQGIRQRYPSDLLLRTISSNVNKTTLKAQIVKHARVAVEDGRTDHRLSFRDAWLSGVCYRLYYDEIFGNTPDFNSVALTHIKDGISEKDPVSEMKSDKALMSTQYFRKSRRDIRYDYESWKRALGLNGPK